MAYTPLTATCGWENHTPLSLMLGSKRLSETLQRCNNNERSNVKKYYYVDVSNVTVRLYTPDLHARGPRNLQACSLCTVAQSLRIKWSVRRTYRWDLDLGLVLCYHYFDTNVGYGDGVEDRWLESN